MAGEWRELELKELVEISTDKVELSTVEAEYYISTDNMLPNFGGIDFNLNKPSVSKTSRFQKDEILFSNIRTYFRKLWLAERNGACSNDVIVFRPRSHTSPRFLFYSLMDERFIEHTVQTSKGTKMPRGDKNAILKYIAKLPPLPEQKAIAHVLGSLDDKIELNRRMNETLEGMAQALFKSWFVDFDPVIDNALAAGNPIPEPLAQRAETRRQALANGTANRESAQAFPASFRFTEELGWIPEGWDVSTVGNKFQTVLGGTPARKNEAYWTDGTIGWINSGKINEFRITEPSEFITEDALSKSATKLLPKRTTLLAITGATLGQVSLNEIVCCANQSVVGIVGSDNVCNEFIYLWVNSIIDKIISSQTGGAQQHINKGNIQDAPLLLPSQNLLDTFKDLCTSSFDKISLNCFESQTLAKLRDVLLPKLISGELRIPQAEKMVEDAIG